MNHSMVIHLTSNSVYAADDQPANPQRPRATITGQDAVYTLGEFFTPESHARLFKQATEPGRSEEHTSELQSQR